jgi:hypothetical protein
LSKPSKKLKAKKKEKKAAQEVSEPVPEPVSEQDAIDSYLDTLKREDEELALAQQARSNAKIAKAEAKAEAKRIKAEAKAEKARLRRPVPPSPLLPDSDNSDFENEDTPLENPSEEIEVPILDTVTSEERLATVTSDPNIESTGIRLNSVNRGPRMGFTTAATAVSTAPSAPFVHMNLRQIFQGDEHHLSSWEKDRHYNLLQQSNALKSCRVKSGFNAAKVRARMLAEAVVATILTEEQSGIFALLQGDGSTELLTEEALIESWDIVQSVIAQTKFILPKSNVDDSDTSASRKEKDRVSKDMCTKFIKSLKQRLKPKSVKKGSGKNPKTVQCASKEEIRAKVNSTQDKRVIDLDVTQLEVLTRTAGRMRDLNQVGAHTKQLSSLEKVHEALLAIWPSLSNDQPVFQRNIFIEIFNRIGDIGITQMSGSIGRSLQRFRHTFGTEELIDFSFEHRGDIMEPFSPLWNYPHQLESFQIEAIELIDQGHSVVIGAPTSSGKTFVALYCIQDNKDTLMLYPTDELAKQAAGTIRNQQSEYGEYTPIIYISGLDIIQDKDARVVIGTPIDVFNYYMIENATKVNSTCEKIIEDFDTYGTEEHSTFSHTRVKNLAAFDTIVLDEF